MNKIVYLMGKSSSGKDTIYHRLKEEMPELGNIVLYTTRPAREGEKEGREYHFISEEQVHTFEEAGKVIELRAYDTVHGIWKYLTVDDGQIRLDERNYLVIGTLESYDRMRAYFGDEAMLPVYVEVEDGVRLSRALKREMEQKEPKYAEMCRRYLADSRDFSEERLQEAGIARRFQNEEIGNCIREIKLYLDEKLCYNNKE
jgi:guanylate kinase